LISGHQLDLATLDLRHPVLDLFGPGFLGVWVSQAVKGLDQGKGELCALGLR
jgi:hypothetical protein